MSLEQLVPPLELCKKIPQGKFADSALVWMWDLDGDPGLFPRECGICNQYGTEIAIAPAPTLAEILEALPTRITGRDNCRFYLRVCDLRLVPRGYWQIGYAHTAPRGPIFAEGRHRHDQTNPATAALKLWLEINANGEESKK